MADQGDWKSEGFRRKVITQIDDALRTSNSQMSKSSMEMENHVFTKAKSRDEYLALVARLILHVKDYNNQKQNKQGGGPGGVGTGAMMGPGPGVGPGPGPGGPTGPPGAMQPQMGPGGGAMPNQMGQTGIPDPLSSLQHMTFTPGMQAPPMVPGMPGPGSNQQQQQQQMQHQMQQQQQQQRQAMMNQLQQQQNRMSAQQAQQQRGHLVRQDAFMVTSSQNVQPMVPGQQSQPSTNSPQVSSQGAVPSPAQQGSVGPPQLGGSPMSMMSPSAGIVPSPGPRTNLSMNAPSPINQPLNTPGNPNSVGASPSPAGQSEDPYLEKLKSLYKYIEPLRRMIKKSEDGKSESDQRNKLKNLHDILTNPSKRVSITALQKCEDVLEKLMGPKMSSASSAASAAASAASSAAATGSSSAPTPHVHMCQPLMDSVARHIQSTSFNHTLQRTFGPAMSAIFGNPIRPPSPPPKRRKVEEPSRLPDILQGEIARLDQRFKVKLDPIRPASSADIYLMVRLDDKHLPSIPPILVTVPHDYPENSPECSTHRKDYDASPFLRDIQTSIVTHLVDLPSRFTFTSLLDMWEMSVRKACISS